MQALLFAAGLGTRLRPYTDDRPKALVEVAGIPLLQLHLERLSTAGFTRVVVNIHHFADRMEAFLRSREWGMEVLISDERDLLLETGGGLLKAMPHFGDAQQLLLINVDVLTNLDLRGLWQSHISQGAEATLASRDRKSSRVLLWDDQLRLSGWRNTEKSEERIVRPDAGALTPLAFSGVHILSADLVRRMALLPLAQQRKFSITDAYLDLAGQGADIRAFRHDTDFWMDVGRPEHLEQAAQHLHLLR
jgi:NDP-sugar pyrophosphorylase family protein